MIEQATGPRTDLSCRTFLSLELMVLVRPWLGRHAMVRPNARSSPRQPPPQGGASQSWSDAGAVGTSHAFLQDQGGYSWGLARQPYWWRSSACAACRLQCGSPCNVSPRRLDHGAAERAANPSASTRAAPVVSDIVPVGWSSTPGAAAATWLARHARAGLRARSSHPEPMPQRDGIALVVWGPSPRPSAAAESARSAAGATATTVPLALVGGTVGYSLGIVLARFVGQRVFGAVPEFSFLVLGVILALAAVVTLLGSAIPLRRASRYEPAPILRGE